MSSSPAPAQDRLAVYEILTEDDVRHALRERCAAAGTQKAAAAELGIDSAIVCAVLNGKRVSTAALQAALGIEAVLIRRAPAASDARA